MRIRPPKQEEEGNPPCHRADGYRPHVLSHVSLSASHRTNNNKNPKKNSDKHAMSVSGQSVAHKPMVFSFHYIFTWLGCYGLCLCLQHKPTEITHSFFILFLNLFLSLWPFQLYFIPYTLPTTLRFLTLFFRSYICFIGPCNYLYIYDSSISLYTILCG